MIKIHFKKPTVIIQNGLKAEAMFIVADLIRFKFDNCIIYCGNEINFVNQKNINYIVKYQN